MDQERRSITRRILFGADSRATLGRLGVELPLCLLVPMIMIQSRPEGASVSPHGNEPLYLVGSVCLKAHTVLGLAGTCLALFGPRTWTERMGYLTLLIIASYITYAYLDANAVAYA